MDVCPLCQEVALEHGWVARGARRRRPPIDRRRRQPRGRALLGSQRAEEAPVAAEPILRRLSEPELDVVEAADLFNASPYRRTVAGIAKSLGPPQASIVPLSGVSGEMIVTVAWEISWYQYRVTPESRAAGAPRRARPRPGGARGELPRLERAASPRTAG